MAQSESGCTDNVFNSGELSLPPVGLVSCSTDLNALGACMCAHVCSVVLVSAGWTTLTCGTGIHTRAQTVTHECKLRFCLQGLTTIEKLSVPVLSPSPWGIARQYQALTFPGRNQRRGQEKRVDIRKIETEEKSDGEVSGGHLSHS